MVFNMRNDLDPYGIYLGAAIDAVSTLRGTVSAAASGAGNFADQGITIYGVSPSPSCACECKNGTCLGLACHLQCVHCP
jgi:hypothetical protein